jgi:hypothetical protein
MAAAFGLSSAQPASGADARTVPERITAKQLAELVAEPASLIGKGDFVAADAAFARLLAARSARHGAESLAVADHLTAFGLALFGPHGEDARDKEGRVRSLAYLRRAIPIYRRVFGAHEEVALAINSYADAALIVSADEVPDDLDALLEEAVAIRAAASGDPAALANILMAFGDVRGAPSRTRADAAAIEASAAIYRRAMPLLAEESLSPGPDNRFEAHFRMAAMYVRNGRPADAEAVAAEAVALQPPDDSEDENGCAALGWELTGLISILGERGYAAEADALRRRFERELPCFRNLPRDVPGLIPGQLPQPAL